MKFIDLFAGIGGFRSGLEKNGHECIAFCEIDKYARQSYKAIYDTEGENEWHDITTVSNEEFRLFRGRADIITGGFPCQAFSIAGNRRGFDDTRGTLFFEIARAIKEIQPSYALLENVKGLFSHDKGRTFGTIIQALDELGYIVEWGLFNSKFWGVPQNRERVYILATRKDVYDHPKLFDLLKQQTEVTTRLVDVLENEVDEKFYLSEEKANKLVLDVNPNNDGQREIKVLGNTSNTGHRSHNIHDVEGLSPTIAARDYKGAKQIAVPRRVSKDFKEIVKVRKYTVDTEKLSQLLKESKSKSGVSSRQIAEKLNIPKTKVEHYFRTDSSFAIPDSEIWEDLKTIIKFDSNEFDTAIHTFVEKESEFDTTNRIYDSNYISPTLNTVNQPKIIQSDSDNDKEKVYSLEELENRFMNESDFLKQGEIKQIIFDEFGVDRKCTRCNNQVLISDIKGYPYLCFECGENLFENETYKDIEGVIGSTQKNAATTDGTLSPTLTSAMGQGGGHVPMAVYKELIIRKLTPLECWRLQGFTDDQFYKAKNAGVSNSQLYKQAGNSVTVNVIDAIARKL